MVNYPNTSFTNTTIVFNTMRGTARGQRHSYVKGNACFQVRATACRKEQAVPLRKAAACTMPIT
jgi:hypothetical protein